MDPHSICRKWVARIGMGFHPDTRGKDYVWTDWPDVRLFDADTAREYDRDMDELFRVAADPYECAIMAMADAGLC